MTYPPHEAPRIYPSFRFNNASAMIDWLTHVLGFTVLARHDNEDGSVGHAELAFGSSIIMCGDTKDDAFGKIVGGPGSQGGKALYIAVDQVDALFAKVKASGVDIVEGLTDRDYGSREFTCRDPEGNVWCFGTYRPKAAG
jgi:uncharacterized glyoxalase superfamily protein PhnB